MKKNEVKKLSPGGCLQSLNAYHENVFMLVTTVESSIQFIENERIKEMLSNAVSKVKEFYNAE